VADQAGQPEVNQPDDPSRRRQHVSGMDIAVHHPQLVQVGVGLGHPATQVQQLASRPGSAAQPGGSGVDAHAVAPLHNHPRVVVGLPDREQAGADPAVEVAQHLDFPAQRTRTEAGARRPQHLQRR
jgi:hypothetical protein